MVSLKTNTMKANSFQNYLEGLHRNHAGIDAGEVASYIPKLLKADPAWLGIALIMVDGHTYQVGDSRQPFTIQSISKAVTYGLALEDRVLKQCFPRWMSSHPGKRSIQSAWNRRLAGPKTR